jgi:hypothetical protein
MHQIFARPTIGERAEIVIKDPDFGQVDSAIGQGCSTSGN